MIDLHALIAEALSGPEDDPMIRFGEARYSRYWVRSLSDRLEALLVKAGIAVDAPIGFVARNRPPFAAALLSLIAHRRSIAMIYAMQSATAIAADIGKLKVAAVIADAADWSDEAIAAARATGTLGISLSLDAADVVTVVPGTACRGTHRAPLDEPGIELLTSGTTGPPKRLPVSYRLIGRSMVGETVTSDAAQANAPRVPGLVYLPFGNISGVYTLLPAVASGRGIVLLERFTVEAWHAMVRDNRPASIGLPPAGLRMVLDAGIAKADLASLRVVNSGTSRLDADLVREFETTYGIPIVTSYGATEFAGPVSNMTLAMREEFGASKLGSVGRPWAGAELRVIDADTCAVLEPNAPGILEVMAPLSGEEGIRTTDIARIDEDGFLYILGRADGAIVRGGFKILPDVVAAALANHPAVFDACVVPLDDRRLGQVPVAAVELREGAPRPSEDELKAHVREQLYVTHVPTRILIVDRLPRTPSMKVSLVDVVGLFQ
ncbi:N/A [soil metagenome]